MHGKEWLRSRDQPKVYLIRARGYLDGSWSDRLAGMQVTVLDRETEPLTELVGRLPDQSALMGILTALYDLGLPILVVNSLSEPGGPYSKEGEGKGRNHAVRPGCNE